MNPNNAAYMMGCLTGYVVRYGVPIILIIYFFRKKKRKPLIITSLILSLLVITKLISCSIDALNLAKKDTASTVIKINESDYTGYTDYEDVLDNVEAKYPDNWELLDTKTLSLIKSNAKSAFGFIDNSRNDCKVYILCLLLSEEIQISLDGTDVMAKGTLDELSSVFKSTSISKASEIISVGRRNFGTYQVTAANEGLTFTQLVMYTPINNGTLMTILNTTMNSVSEEDEITLYKVAASFKKMD